MASVNGKKVNNASMYDPNWLIQAGINPKTGLPLKWGNDKTHLYENVKKLLRIKDEQTAVNRYSWFNTFLEMPSNAVERFFYYKFQLGFFYFNGRFYIMPFALDGGLDFYGRENLVHPVPYNEDNSDASKRLKEVLSQIKLRPVREPLSNPTREDMLNSVVIIQDYTPQASIGSGIPRATLQDGIIDFEARIIPYMRTAMILATGIKGVRVADADEEQDILEGSESADESALRGNPWIPLRTKLDFSELAGNAGTSQEYLLAMQGIDNFRESCYGVNSGGLFTKKQYTNRDEIAMNSQIDFPLTDGLRLRQDACDIINSIWGIGITCEISETALGADTNGDGIADDSNTGGTENEPDTQEQPEDVR